MFNLLRYFSFTSAAAILVIALAMHAAYRQNAVDDLVSMAERHNVALAQSFANTLWSRYASHVTSVSGADGDTLRAHPETRNIHEALKTLTTELPVLKVKIYDLDGLTVFSSQPSQMGDDKSENLGFLSAALDGTPASKLSYRDSFSAFSSTVHDRDLVETYIPIRGADGRIEGVFELYTDVTPLVAKIGTNSTLFLVGLLFSFGLLYAILFLIIRRADIILKNQYLDLRSSENRIKAKNVELEYEVTERKRAEVALLEAHDRLEERVQERTTALQKANADLLAEVAERTGAEEALRESEALFRAVVNNSPTKIHIKNADGRYVLINSVAEKLFGVTDQKARGKTTQQIFAGKQADAFIEHDQAVLKSGQSIEQEEEWLLDDGIQTFLTVKFPILDAAGSIVAIGAIGTEITERKRAEKELQYLNENLQMQSRELEETADYLTQARNQAEISNRAKSEFLAAMSHELRTPLNAIIGFSEIIKHETFGPVGSVRYRDYAQDIHESGQHLLGLINDILDLSKIESGADALHEEDIEVSEIANASLKLIEQRAVDGGINLELELSDQLPALHADKRKLKQILVNLLANAVKFTAAGGEVTLRAWCRRESGYVFQIVDTGIGIAPEDIPKALSRFGQVDADLNRRYEGTGLGLPLTKALVELHGGSLDLQSEVDVGTTATVRFPATRVVLSSRGTNSAGKDDRMAG